MDVETGTPPAPRATKPGEVVAAVIRRHDVYLLGRRPEHKHHGGLWEFPGGKVHAGEDDLQAAQRELAEELDLEVASVGRVLFVAIDPGAAFEIRFVEVSVEGDPRALEHTEIRWARAEELAAMNLAPADARFVRDYLLRPGGPEPEQAPHRHRHDFVTCDRLRAAPPPNTLPPIAATTGEAAVNDLELEALRYPVGRLSVEPELTPEQRSRCIDEIAAMPARLRAAVEGLDQGQLDTPYRPGGWTVRQVVHHVPDSHLNSYVRFKLGATEEEPTIVTYEEARWAEELDGREGPVDVSLTLLEALHDRWVRWLRNVDEEGWQRAILHPELGRMSLEQLLQVYCWHSRHHVAHITRLRARMGWD
jgi:mutator protein MutT